MRLVEIRLLEGPNVYRLEPVVKLEVAIGRRRTWYGQRDPGRTTDSWRGTRAMATLKKLPQIAPNTPAITVMTGDDRIAALSSMLARC